MVDAHVVIDVVGPAGVERTAQVALGAFSLERHAQVEAGQRAPERDHVRAIAAAAALLYGDGGDEPARVGVHADVLAAGAFRQHDLDHLVGEVAVGFEALDQRQRGVRRELDPHSRVGRAGALTSVHDRERLARFTLDADQLRAVEERRVERDEILAREKRRERVLARLQLDALRKRRHLGRRGGGREIGTDELAHVGEAPRLGLLVGQPLLGERSMRLKPQRVGSGLGRGGESVEQAHARACEEAFDSARTFS